MSLPETLIKQSSLTQRQLETLQSYLRVVLGETSYREAAAGGPAKKVTIGSYYRTLQQAKGNIRESIVTLLVAIWLGLVRQEDVRRLLDVTNRDIADLPGEEKERLVAVLGALLDRIIT